MQSKFEKHISVVESQQSVLECLHENVELSKQKIKQVMQNGAVWLETEHGITRIRRAKKTVHQGEVVHLYYNLEIQDKKPQIAELIADEGDYSIWNKPSGMYSQGSKWGDHCSIYRWAEQHLKPERPAFIVHRLDRAAHGLMILAHKKSVATQFSNLFAKNKIYKQYSAVVEGQMLGYPLPFEINNKLDDKVAISEIISLTLDEASNTTKVGLVIKTGRKHQIRQHLASMGFPIVGDRLYGAKNIESDLQLASVCLKFICPVTAQQKEYYLNDNETLRF